jgi:hypothetical protein
MWGDRDLRSAVTNPVCDNLDDVVLNLLKQLLRARGRAGRNPPVIEDSRQMQDLLFMQPIGDSKQQVVILRPIEACAETAYAREDVMPQNHQVTYVIHGQEEVGIEVRLEEGRMSNHEAEIILFNAVLIGVNEGKSAFLELEDDVIESLRR